MSCLFCREIGMTFCRDCISQLSTLGFRWSRLCYVIHSTSTDKGSSVCLAAAAVKVWDEKGNSDEIHPAHLHNTEGPLCV